MALPGYLQDTDEYDLDYDPYYGGETKAVGTALSLGSLIPGLGLGFLGPLGMALGGLGQVLGIFGGRSAKSREEELQRRREALQRAIMLSRSFEQAGRRWY